MDSNRPFRPTNTPVAIDKYKAPYETYRIETITRYIPEGMGRDAIDLGSGPGYFSRLLTSRGWKTTSVDTNPENIEAAKRSGLEAKLGDAIGVLSTLPPDRYDLVLALELIEHMPKPDGMTMVREIHRVLKPGGTLFLSTPNRWSLEGLAAYYWGEKIRGWGKWEAWDPTHLHIYNAEEIMRLVKSCGLMMERVVGYYYESTLPMIGRFRLPLRASAHWPLNRLGFNTILICRKPGGVRL